MSVGIIYIGFAGSRFTMQFSQGFFSYMINVGTKILVLYLIIAVEGQYLPNILFTAAGALGTEAIANNPAGFFGSEAIVGGAGFSAIQAAAGAAAYTLAAVAALQVVIAAGLVWSLPGFAASLLTGQSTASGAAVLSQAVQSMAGAQQMMAQMGASNRAEKRIEESRSERSEMSQAGASNGQPVGGAGVQTLAPPQQGETFDTGANGATGAPGASGASGSGGATANIGVSTGSNGNGAPRQAFGPGFNTNGVTVPATPTQSTARQLPSTGTAPSGNAAFSPLAANAAPYAAPAAFSPPTGNTAQTSDMSAGTSDPNIAAPRDRNGQPMGGPPPSEQRPANDSIGFGEVSADEIRGMTSKVEASRLASATPKWGDVTVDRQNEIMRNPITRDAMYERLNNTEQDARRDEDFANAYMLGGLAQAAPREIGQPTAVQVRISNPDKL